MQELANSRHGKCLSTNYKNNKIKLEWQCSKGHIWNAVTGDIKDGHWCPYCGGSAKKSIQDCKRIAAEKGGQCLSNEYTNNKTMLKWKCEKSHIWESSAHNIVAGHWCHKCAIEKRIVVLKKYVRLHKKTKKTCKQK